MENGSIQQPDFQTAMSRIKAIQNSEGPNLHPLGRTRMLSHGKKTATAVLWFHGYSTCPQQFVPLAQKCFEKGMNVYIPRAPHHGINDRLTQETRKLTEEQLKAWAEECLILASALGKKLVVGGLSMGGAITSWLAQIYPQVDIAVIIAPAIAYRAIPSFLRPIVVPINNWLPDRMRWWDRKLKEKEEGPDYAYAWVSAHGLTIFPRIGAEVKKLYRKSPPAAREIWMVINDHDESIDDVSVEKFAKDWQKSKPGAVHIYHFPVELGLIHDCISVEQPRQKVDIVYPVLMDIVTGKLKV